MRLIMRIVSKTSKKIDNESNTIEGTPWGAIGWERAVQWLRKM